MGVRSKFNSFKILKKIKLLFLGRLPEWEGGRLLIYCLAKATKRFDSFIFRDFKKMIKKIIIITAIILILIILGYFLCNSIFEAALEFLIRGITGVWN